MALQKRYNPQETEPSLLQKWEDEKIYYFDVNLERPVFSIDTPPATVSGNLHMGHIYSYSHTDFIARFKRMQGYQIFYPMGFDDNGLPTERLVEKKLGIKPKKIDHQTYVNRCLELSKEFEYKYENLWKRLGLSIDWRYTYRTIDHDSIKISQYSFLDLYNKGLIYQKEAPTIWCPECQTAIAQADLVDITRRSKFFRLKFFLENSTSPNAFLPIATTRPELLSACVAIFVHPEDKRYQNLLGSNCIVPIFGQLVPVLEDPDADPHKGTGAVMCCTFGDQMDVSWWNKYDLPMKIAIDHDGRMTSLCGDYQGLTTAEARQEIIKTLTEEGVLIDSTPTEQSIRVHERCDTPVEYIVSRQWFLRILEHKEAYLKAGDNINWHPDHMKTRYISWVENLKWDWCISRQRYYGVPFPLWYCQNCGEVILAEADHLPVDPLAQKPHKACKCGSTNFTPETDVMDTWATSSLTPQIAGHWKPDCFEEEDDDPLMSGLFERVFPYSLRPQAHEIIRTWAFYTIVKSHHHLQQLPWDNILISGWGLAGEGMGKISKSRGGGPFSPEKILTLYSADAVRYWAASAGPGKDLVINEEKIKMGAKLANKMWNVARFYEHFQHQTLQQHEDFPIDILTPADKWILSLTQSLIRHVTELFENYDYAAAKNETEAFFWRVLTDNYLEMCKQRLYDENDKTRFGALYSLDFVIQSILKLFSPIMPFITEAIYLQLFITNNDAISSTTTSLHTSPWPQVTENLHDPEAEQFGELLVAIASSVRRYKSENNLALSTPIQKMIIQSTDADIKHLLSLAEADLSSITRSEKIIFTETLPGDVVHIYQDYSIKIAIHI
jgi:valyl-tRNA synthetase